MSNFSKLNKNDVSEVSGGWYARYSSSHPFEDQSVTEEHLDVYDSNGKYLGKTAGFLSAKKLAEKNGCEDFELEKSNLSVFTREYEESIK